VVRPSYQTLWFGSELRTSFIRSVAGRFGEHFWTIEEQS
jgi:hypothetical protein